MRLIKLALISIIFMFLLVTAISLLIPSHIRVSKAINLPGSSNVFAFIKDESKWQLWHPVYQDSALRRQWGNVSRRTVSDTDSTFIIELQQPNRKPVVNGWEVHRYTSADSLTLQWYMDFKLSWYPWEKFSSLFYEKNFGVMMERGLTNLKATVY